jgi:hypothetical protein
MSMPSVESEPAGAVQGVLGSAGGDAVSRAWPIRAIDV